LMERAQGGRAALTANAVCSQKPERLLWPR